MSERITRRMVEDLVQRLNMVSDSPLDAVDWVVEDNQTRHPYWNVNHFMRDTNMTGSALVRVVSEDGGIVHVTGYLTLRELMHHLQGTIATYERMRKERGTK